MKSLFFFLFFVCAIFLNYVLDNSIPFKACTLSIKQFIFILVLLQTLNFFNYYFKSAIKLHKNQNSTVIKILHLTQFNFFSQLNILHLASLYQTFASNFASFMRCDWERQKVRGRRRGKEKSFKSPKTVTIMTRNNLWCVEARSDSKKPLLSNMKKMIFSSKMFFITYCKTNKSLNNSTRPII